MNMIRTPKASWLFKNKYRFFSCLTAFSYPILMLSHPVYAKGTFNPSFLSPDTASVADLSRFEQGKQQPGNYRVDLYFNDYFLVASDLPFIASDETNTAGALSGGLTPCFDAAWLKKFNLKTETIPNFEQYEKEQCIPIKTLIPEAEISYNFNSQKVTISMPQALLRDQVRGYIPPTEWEEGITAGLLNYSFSGDNGTQGDSYFLALESGLNWGAWRLRNNTTWTHNESSKNITNTHYKHDRWSNISTYAQRAIIPLKSELVIGDSNSARDVYESMGFRGVRLYSSDAMLPDSLQGFAPTVRGIARSRAKVVIRQNGYVIYQTYVSPGPFLITDLNPTASSGDLTVTVEETEGGTQTFKVPFSTVPLLQREGRLKYDVIAGRYRSGRDDQNDPFFTQATLIAGLKSGFTAYGGTQLASKYKALTLGFGRNMGDWGAVSVDATHANSTLVDDSHHQGQSFRFLYNKSLNQYGTTFQLLGYRYSTHGFYTLDDVAYDNIEGYRYGFQTDDYGNKVYTTTGYHNLNHPKKGHFQLNVNQNLANYGSAYASINVQDYWNTDEQDKTYQLGYANVWHKVNYSLSWSLTETVGINKKDNLFSFNISVPLSALFRKSHPNTTSVADRMFLTGNALYNSDRNLKTWQTGLSGTLLRDNNLSYNMTQGHSASSGTSGNIGAQLQGTYGNAGVGYSYARDLHDFNYQFSGGVIAHKNGITFGQPLGDTNILIKAPGAAGVGIENKTGVATDYRGYAIVPYANVYRLNRIALDTNTMKNNTEIQDNVQNLVPTRGAVVAANFKTHIGLRALMYLRHQQRIVPFGASVKETTTNISSIVGEDGMTYLSGLPDKGMLQVEWGKADDQQCKVAYDLSHQKDNTAVHNLELNCDE